MIHTVAETGSTNADLAAALRGGELLVEGHWLVADRQTAGRGRQGREWFDGAGNFMGSTVVVPGHGDPPSPTLALVAGLATYEAALPWLATPSSLRLKWPNDLMIGPAKLAGILLEREGGRIIVGIGVNLTRAPIVEGRETISLADLGPPPSRDAFAKGLVHAFDRELERWRNFGLEPLIRRWESVAHPLGTPLRVVAPGDGIVEGSYDGLQPDGALTIRLADGTSRAIHAGDVTIAKQES